MIGLGKEIRFDKTGHNVAEWGKMSKGQDRDMAKLSRLSG